MNYCYRHISTQNILVPILDRTSLLQPKAASTCGHNDVLADSRAIEEGSTAGFPRFFVSNWETYVPYMYQKYSNRVLHVLRRRSHFLIVFIIIVEIKL